MSPSSFADLPKFGEPMHNATVSLGREAVFSCTVDNLQTYKVSAAPSCVSEKSSN